MPRTSAKKHWLRNSGLLITLLPVLFWLSLRFGLATPLVNYLSNKYLQPLAGYQIQTSSFRTDLFSMVQLHDVLVLTRSAGHQRPLAAIQTIQFKFRLADLLLGRINVEDFSDSLHVNGLNVFVLRDAQGQWNWAQRQKEAPAAVQNKEKKSLEEQLAPWAGRFGLANASIVFSDEMRNFQSTLTHINGNVDARSLPLVTMNFSGRTDDQPKDNLSLSADYRVDKNLLKVRSDLQKVPLKRYFNYGMPQGGMAFRAGRGDLHLRLYLDKGKPSLKGSAFVSGAELSIPGVRAPLSELEGEVAFQGERIILNGIQAEFLGSKWQAQGEVFGLEEPELNLIVKNPMVDMAVLSSQVRGMDRLPMAGNAALSITVTGKAQRPRVEGTLSSVKLEVLGFALRNLKLEVLSQGNELVLRRVQSEIADGQLEAAGHFVFPDSASKSGLISATAKIVDAKLEMVSRHGDRLLPLLGSWGAVLHANGSFRNPSVSLKVHSSDAAMGTVQYGPIVSSWRLFDHKLSAYLNSQSQPISGQVEMKLGESPHIESARCHIAGMPIETLLLGLSQVKAGGPIADRILERLKEKHAQFSGALDLMWTAKGDLSDPEMSIHSNSPRILIKPNKKSFFRLKGSKDHLILGLVGALSLKNSKLIFGSAGSVQLGLEGKGYKSLIVLKGDYPLNLRAASDIENPLEMEFNGDLKILGDMVLVQDSAGPISSKMNLLGYGVHVRPQGELIVDIRKLILNKGLRPVDSGYFKFEFGDGKISLKDAWMLGKSPYKTSVVFNANLDFSKGDMPVGKIHAVGEKGKAALAMFQLPWLDKLSVWLNPLQIHFYGGDRPVLVSGEIQMEDGLIIVPTLHAAEAGLSSGEVKSTVLLDLKIGLKDSIVLDKPTQTQIVGQKTLIGNFLKSLQTGVLDPSLNIQVRPTQNDLVVQGDLKAPEVRGRLDIVRGKLLLLGRNFTVTEGFVAFDKGRRADVHARAETIVREETQPGQSTPVKIFVDVAPWDEATLEKMGQTDVSVNFSNMQFSSKPEKQQQAVLSLLLLGADVTIVGGTEDAASQRAALSSAAAARGFQFAWNYVLSLLPPSFRAGARKVFKLDYFKVFPRFQRGQIASTIQSSDSAEAASQAAVSQVDQTDLIMDAGLSLAQNVFLRGQMVRFAETDKASTAIVDSNVRELASSGYRMGFEWYLNNSRTWEINYNINMDENLEALPLVPGKPLDSQSLYVGIRNTIGHEAYNASLAKKRRWKREEE